MSSSTESGAVQIRAWSANVPKEVLDSVSKDEQKRQEAIYELIYTEEDYVRDLDLLDEVRFGCGYEKSRCAWINVSVLLEIVVRKASSHSGLYRSQSSGGILERRFL